MKFLQINIEEPCHESWEGMHPTKGGRHCDACQKQVVDLSLFTDYELARFFHQAQGPICGRMHVTQLQRPIPTEFKSGGRSWQKPIIWSLALILSLKVVKAGTDEKIISPATNSHVDTHVKQVKTGEVALIDSESTIKSTVEAEHIQDSLRLNKLIETARLETIAVPPERMVMGAIAVSDTRVTFHGKVLDASGRPLVHATVQLVGTAQLVYTDEIGNYTLSIPNFNDAKGKRLLVSATHYQQVSEPLDSAKNFELNIRLQPIPEKNDNTIIMGKMKF